jgi:N-acetylmuramic acid 6-phosphate etherase
MKMSTERSSPRYSSIDVWNAEDIAEAIVESQFAAVAAVYAVRKQIASAAVAMQACLQDRGRLIYAGAGTSGRLAVQDGAELAPTFGWPDDRLLLLIAGGEEALLRSVEGAEDDAECGTRLVAQHAVTAQDVLIAVAASGTTRFTLACLREAKRCGALTLGIANNGASPILDEADHPIFLDTGSEPIAGSTRLKAGTAQKVALNTLSTLLMTLLGKVHRGLMVDVRAVNEKLVKRSEDMLIQLTGRSRDDVRNALSRANGSVKVAVMLLHGCDLETAKQLLGAAGDRLGAALDRVSNAQVNKDKIG